MTDAEAHIRAFLIAVQFLTRVPVPGSGTPRDENIGLSVAYYPLVGLLLGVGLGMLALAVNARVPPMLAAALVLAVWVFMTGGLHLDGLGDTADAWACGGDRGRMLAVMKDPNCGPAAVSTIVVVLLLKFAALTALIDGKQWAAIALAPMLGRVSAPVLFLTSPYVRVGGIGSAMAAHLPRRTAWTVTGLSVAAALTFGPVLAVVGVAITLMAIWRAVMAKLGGITGDTIGAAIVLSEMVALTMSAL